MRAKRVVIVVAGLALAGLVALGITAALVLPGYVEREALRQIRERGLELDSYELDFGWRWVKLTNARGRLVGVRSLSLRFGTVDVKLEGRHPQRIDLAGVDVQAVGSAPTIALELGAWTKRFPSTFALPLFAQGVEVAWRPDRNEAPWLEVKDAAIAKTPASTLFNARRVKVAGGEVGKVGAAWTASSSSVAIGLGEPELAKAPLKVEVQIKERPVVIFRLSPTPLEKLSQPFAVELPVQNTVGSGEVELTFASQEALVPVDGRAHLVLEGWIPPHPVELSGFVFGKVTTFDTKLLVSGDMKTVTLTDSKVRAGKFELSGGGTIVRHIDHALIDLLMSGNLPCPALAGAAAESRLGRLLGAAAGKFAGAAARQLVQGTVAVEVRVNADSRKLKEAQVQRRIGIGCGLKPLTLDELRKLGDLLPIPEELSDLADEMAKLPPPDLALPPPSAFPKLPPLPSNLPQLPRLEIDFGTGGSGARKRVAPEPGAEPANQPRE